MLQIPLATRILLRLKRRRGGLSGNSQPFAQRPIISSGVGDVVLTPDRPVGKKRRWKTFFVVGLSLIAIVAGAFVLTMLLKEQKKTDDSNILKSSFNELTNYVVYGRESEERVERGKIEDGWYYAFEINDSADNQEEQYVTNLNGKFSAFSMLYYENGGDLSLDSAMIYFEDFMNLKTLSYDDILAYYIEYGYDVAVEKIENFYAIDSYDNIEMNNLVVAKIKLAGINLDFINLANSNGCFAEGLVVVGCSYLDQEQYSILESEYSEISRDILDLRRELRFGVVEVLANIWDELYGESDE